MGKQPIDQGWSWVICLGTGVQSFFVIGGLKSMGVLFVEVLEMFDAPPTVVSLTLGMVAAGFAVVAMMANAFARMVGCRLVVLTGACLFCLSTFLSMFAVSIWYLIITLGLLSGMAFGLMITPSIYLLTLYFDKWRSFSNGLAMALSSVGQITMPYITTYLVEQYGFRGAMLLYTAIAMHAIPAALLLRPVSFWSRRRHDVATVIVTPAQELSDKPETPLGSYETLRELPDPDLSSTGGEGYLLKSRTRSMDVLQGSRILDPLPPHHRLSKSHTSLARSSRSLRTQQSKDSVLARSALSLAPVIPQDQLPVLVERRRWRCCCITCYPMTPAEFLRTIFDRELMRSPTLWLLFISMGTGHAGFMSELLHIPVLSVELFGDKYKGALLISIIGVFDIVGRLGGGWFADQGYMTRVNQTAVCFIMTGTCTILAMIRPLFPVLAVHGIIMGVFGGIYRILLPVLVGDLFGKAKTASGIGMLYMSLGVIILPVPTLLNYMKKVYTSYIPAFYLCGSFLLFAAFLLFFIPIVKRHDKALPKETNTDVEDSIEIKNQVETEQNKLNEETI